MTNNPILEEIYAAREKFLADAGGDLGEYVKQARARALASGKKLVPAKKPEHDDLEMLTKVYEGLSEEEIDEVHRIATEGGS